MELNRGNWRADSTSARAIARWQATAPQQPDPFSSSDVRLAPSAALRNVAAGMFATFREARNLVGTRLNKSLFRSFRELTGLRLHVVWRDPIEFLQPDLPQALCPRATYWRDQNIHAACRDCLHRHWSSAAEATGSERAFKTPCGAVNFWANLQVGNMRLLTLTLQDLPAGSCVRCRGARISSAAPPPSSKHVRAQTGNRAVPFSAAVTVLKLILHDLEATVAVSILRRELETARLRLKNMATEDAQLRRELHQRAPEIQQPREQPIAGNHSQQIAQRMLDYIHTHYHRPLQLGDLAVALKMNPCYLSNLFSETLGMTFHEYLEEFRLAKAKEQLRDPTRRICEVACAVGHSSAGQFWRVFKARTGVSPSRWRT